MKKVFISIIALVISLSFCTAVFADEKITVSSEDISTKQGETFLLPVEINRNPGIMGFKITVKYPYNQLILKDITSGAVTKTGLFNTSISDFNSVHGSFDVLWSTTENVKTDGTLFILKFEVSNLASNGNYNISLSYSREDTFDENFNDLHLTCSPVKVTINDGTMVETTTAEDKKDNEHIADIEISNDFLISAFESVRASFNANNLSEEDKSNIVRLVNNLLKSYDVNAIEFDSYEELYSAYKIALKNQTIDEVIQSTDGDIIITATNEVLNEHNAKTFSDIPEDKQQEAVEKVKERLANNNSEMKTFDKIYDDNLAVETLDELVDKANEQEKENIEITDSNNSKKTNTKQIVIITFVVVFSVALIILVCLILKKRRNTK